MAAGLGRGGHSSTLLTPASAVPHPLKVLSRTLLVRAISYWLVSGGFMELHEEPALGFVLPAEPPLEEDDG